MRPTRSSGWTTQLSLKADMTKSQKDRRARLMPGGIPRYVRCYDNGGESADRYTVVFSGRGGVNRPVDRTAPHQWRSYCYRAMSERPYHPQGVGMWGEHESQPVDTLGEKPGWHWPPAVGRKCHLGTRIRFQDLPEDCRKLVLRDYREIWRIE